MVGAISADGSKVFWTDTRSSVIEEGFLGIGPGDIYLRVNATAAPSPIAGGARTDPRGLHGGDLNDRKTRFWGADPEGTKALYGVFAANDEELFEYDVDSATSQLIAKGVREVKGFSENLSSVYFVSTEKLTGSQQNSEGAEAVAGAQNLYLRKAGGGFVFIARVQADETVIKPFLRRSRVSPDGLHLAFSTASRLTEYDNTDVLSGTLDSEVYLYDAEVGPVGTLRCVGCNPSGARPHGTLGTASTIPGWFEQLHPSRLLSADGNRLFFNSFDGLVPRDQNTAMDVYLWQRASGQADCQTLGAEYFAADSGGCLSMISGGQGPQNAEVLDASVDGRDLFFTTGVSLLPQDPAQVDVYDARIGGGFPQPEVLSICNVDADNCRPPSQGQSSPSPSSNAKGSGNPPAKTKPKKCPKGKHRVTKKGKSRCVPNKKKAKKGKAANKSGRASR